MSTVDERDGGIWVDTKGAPEALLALCTTMVTHDGTLQPLTVGDRHVLERRVDDYASEGLRVLACGTRMLDPARPSPRIATTT